MIEKTIGSVCSGIEAASLAFSKGLGFRLVWFSEIKKAPSEFLAAKYPKIPNLGDFTKIGEKIKSGEVEAPDIICGGTPCQAFSVNGIRRGLDDDRGQLTLEFLRLIDDNDKKRKGLDKTIVLWENVVGVFSDKTNAFGCFLSGLSGSNVMHVDSWPKSGILHGSKRNVAWRVLDSVYFGLPQTRRRVFVIAGGKDFHPEDILFEIGDCEKPKKRLSGIQKFTIGKHIFETANSYITTILANYKNCTYMNGRIRLSAVAQFIYQDGKLRRFVPREIERIMGFPDNYTKIMKTHARYFALGNSWAVPVVQWLAVRMKMNFDKKLPSVLSYIKTNARESLFGKRPKKDDYALFVLSSTQPTLIKNKTYLNATTYPSKAYTVVNLSDIVLIYKGKKHFQTKRGATTTLAMFKRIGYTVPPFLHKALLTDEDKPVNKLFG